MSKPRVTQFQKGYDEALLDIFDAFKAGGAKRALGWIADNADGRLPGLAREVREFAASQEA